jgi:spermidine synthase
VKPTVIIEKVTTALGEMALSRHDEDFAIRVGGVELMSSHNHQSEDELGRITCASLAKLTAPRLLIGGLGMGFTLRAALDTLPKTAHVDVAELVPEVVRWNRTIYGRLARHPLDDPRVTLIESDVARVIANPARPYDAIVLDVDNGPDGIAKSNDALYQRKGLQLAYAALAPDGLFAVWSSFESPTFTRWVRDVGFTVTIEKVRTWHSGGATHWIWMARKPA